MSGANAEHLLAELRALYQAAGRPTLARLVRLGKDQVPPIRIGDSTISGWLTGSAVPRPDSWPYVIALVSFLKGRLEQPEYLPRSEGWWQQRLEAAWSERTAERGGRSRSTRRNDAKTLAGPVTLPAPPRGFSGRVAALSDLLGQLDPDSEQEKDSTGLSVLAGMGGVGKTALAVYAAHHALVRGWFPGGILFIDLRGYSPNPPAEAGAVADQMLRLLRFKIRDLPPTAEEKLALWRAELTRLTTDNRPLLVVLDNAKTAGQVSPLLTGPPHRMLVTSRNSLAALPAHRIDLDPLTPNEAIDMLGKALRTAQPSDERVSSEPSDAIRLAGLCGHLPLALQIVASLLRDEPTRSLAEQVIELDDARTRLDTLAYDDIDDQGRQLAIRAAFDLSYWNLGTEQARAFRLFALTPATDISTEIAAVLLDRPAPAARRILADLVRAHLLEAHAAGRWGIHDLIRLYADSHGQVHADDDHRDEALDRLLAYLLATTDAALPAHMRVPPEIHIPERFASQEDVWAWLDTEYTSLVAVVDLAYQRQHYTQAIRLSLSLSWYLQRRRHLQDWRTIARTGLLAARALGDRQSEGRALGNVGTVLRQVRQFDEALTADRQAADIFRELGDRQGEVRAIGNLGISLGELRRFDEALTACREAVGIFRELGDPHSEGRALVNLGSVLHEVRQFDEALTADRQAADIFRELGDRYGEGLAIGSSGAVLREMQRFDEAIIAHQQHLAICHELEDRYLTARVLTDLGMVWAELRQLDKAVDAYRQAADIFQEVGDHDRETEVLNKLNIVHHLNEEP